jgi:hypothetical protein
MERPMQKLNDLSRSFTALEADGTLIAVIDMSLSSWLVAGIVCLASSVAIPTAKDEDAKRPNREGESLVGEQNRIITE